MTQAFQINSLFFEQGSDWRRLRDGSSINRVTWGQLARYTIWSTRELHSRYLHSCATSSFLKPGPAGSQVVSLTTEVTCCCIIQQWTTTGVTISSFRWLCCFGFFLEIQEISSGLALQACLRHSHQDPRSFSVITLSYFKVREELPLGQIPLGTIHTSFFYNASTFPHAFTACPHSACFHSVSLAAVAHLSPAPTTTYVSWIQSYSSSKNPGKTLKLQKENMLFHPSWAERRPCSSSGTCSSQELQ